MSHLLYLSNVVIFPRHFDIQHFASLNCETTLLTRLPDLALPVNALTLGTKQVNSRALQLQLSTISS